MKQEQTYQITLLQYAYGPAFSNTMVYSGYGPMAGTTPTEYMVAVLRGGGETILIDCGYDSQRPVAHRESTAQHHQNYHHPAEVLRANGIPPEEVTGVILTHLHWDHADTLSCYPNAKIYVQKRELLGWIETLALPKAYDKLKVSVDLLDIQDCLNAIPEGRLILLDGDVEDLLPGIDIRAAPDGHSWAGNLVAVRTKDGTYVFTGDAAYVRENLLGIGGDGVLLPNGYNCGSVSNLLHTMDDILQMAGHDINKVIISHDIPVWELFDTTVSEPTGLKTARIG